MMSGTNVGKICAVDQHYIFRYYVVRFRDSIATDDYILYDIPGRKKALADWAKQHMNRQVRITYKALQGYTVMEHQQITKMELL